MGAPSAYIDDQFFGSGFADQGSIDLDLNLLWYYALEAESGTREDVGPSSLNLSETGSVTFGPGVITNAASFPGPAPGNRLIHGFDSVYDLSSTDFTVTGWFNLDTIGVGAHDFIYIGTGGGSIGQRILVIGVQGTDISVTLSDGGSSRAASTNIGGSIPTGQYVFFCIRFTSATEIMEIKLNDQNFLSSSFGISPQSQGTQSFVLGGELNGGNAVDGLLDEVGGWDRLLTNIEINFLYNGGAGNRPGLIVTHLGVPVTFEGAQITHSP